MTPNFATLIAMTSTLLLTGPTCGGDGQKPEVRTDMLVSTEWLSNHLDDPSVVILHVGKELRDYEAGHIPGARFVAWEHLTATRDGTPNELPHVADLQQLFGRLGVGDDARLILYGEMSGLFAARAYFTLDYVGHAQRAAVLDGGIEKWQADNQALSTETPAITPLPFTPHVRPDVVIGLDVMQDLSWVTTNVPNPRQTLIDARPADEYNGDKLGEGVPRGEHIPGAGNISWMENLVSKTNLVMRPVDELQQLYEAAGAEPGETVITYCRTGVQASHAYFTAKYLGYNVALFDGSFIVWSNASGTPVINGTE